MSTPPLATLDASDREEIETYDFPLRIVPNGDPLAPELSLVGEVPEDTAYGYRFELQSGLTYRFLANDGSVPPETGMLAYVFAPDNGDLLWANAAARAHFGLPVDGEDTPVRIDGIRDVTLVVADAASRGGETFDLAIHADATAWTDDAIYRFVKLSNGMYFYTASAEERDRILLEYPDFRFEGAVFVGDDQARDGFVPVHRYADLANGGYFYTAQAAEIDAANADTHLRYEGISFYVPGADDDATTPPVYRLRNPETDGYLFTSDPAEKLYALLEGWLDQGIAFDSLAFPAEDASTAPPDTVELVGVAGETAIDFSPG